MSETKPNYDPNNMELPEDFFAKQQRTDEELAMSDFSSEPPIANQPKINTDDDNNGDDITKKPNDYDRGINPDDDDKDKDKDKDKDLDIEFDTEIAQREQEELERLNKELGTDFKTLNDLKEALNKSDQKEVNDEVEQARKYVDYFNTLLDEKVYDDEKLVKEDKILIAIQNQQDPKSPEVAESIEEELERLRETGMMSYAARSIRQTIRAELKEKESIVSTYEQNQQLTQKQKEEQTKNKIKETIGSIFNRESFYGIKPTKDDMVEIYQTVTKNKHLDNLRDNPELAVEFELFRKYQKQISAILDKPGFEAGVRKTLKEMGMSTDGQGTTDDDKSKDTTTDDLSFLQKFAK